MASIALGFTLPLGLDPALSARTWSLPWILANASAIWDRLEFSTHTNKIRLGLFIGLSSNKTMESYRM
jgi:hypothetical protein